MRPRRPWLGQSEAWRAGYREGFDEGLVAGLLLGALAVGFLYAVVSYF